MIKRGLLALFALLLLTPTPAQAEFGLKDLDVVFTNSDGSIANLAGTHPFAFTTTLGVNTTTTPDGEVPEGEIKDLDVFQIPGFVGSQTAVPPCSSADFNTRIEGRPQCPDAAAVGIVAVKAEFDVLPVGLDEYLNVPLYSLEPLPGEAARLGFVALNVPIVISVGVNPEPPYNLVAHLEDVPQSILFYGSKVTIWGDPSNPLHDSLRGNCVGEPLELTKEPVSLGDCPVSPLEEPFLTLPRACTGPLATVFTAASWQDPGAFTPPQSAFTHDDSEPPNPLGMTGCDGLEFDPTVEATPTASEGESPTGLELTVQIEDEGLTSLTGTAKSDIRAVKLTLPEGVTANPSAAEGQGVCTPADFAKASLSVPGCPDSANLGTLEVETPLLKNSLGGSIYLAEPRENPFGTLLALYMVIRDPQNGIFVKLPVKVEADPVTGRLVSTVEDLPQLPFSEFKLHFRKGPRAPLVTPLHCGTYAAEALLTPWSGNVPLPASSTFEVKTGPGGTPCPSGVQPLVPGFEGGSLNNQAGAFSPFYMRLTRSDGQQELTRFDSILPPGVVGKIAGVERCSDLALAVAGGRSGRAELAAPSCPAGSQVGRVVVGAGVGPALTWATGKIYLAGPYGGAPLSVAVVTPAVAGPFDLGTVVVREALNLNPTTAEVEVSGADSPPLPRILEGVPLKLRDLRVFVDRENFTLNPTSCEPSLLRASLFGSAGAVAPLNSRYQAMNCESLGFKPRLFLKMSGGTQRSGHPSLKAVLTPRPGDANIGRAQVRLPRIHFIDQGHISNPCTRVQFNANQCPPGSVLGIARAFTPLLDQPLEGPVYFRSNGGERTLPDIVADLKGQFRVILVGFVDSKKGGVRTTFASPPDAPVSKFVLTLKGGKQGLLVNSGNLCAHTRRADVKLTGQNGKLNYFRQVIKNDCPKGKKAKRQKQRR